MSPSEPFPRKAALIAGFALLFMTFLGPFGFLTMQGHFDAGPTQENIAAIASSSAFTLAIAAFLVVAVLDIAAAWGLYVVFRAADPRMSLISAVLRVVYGLLLAALLLHLFRAAALAQDGSPATIEALSAFLDGWLLSLGIFGLHLVLLGLVGFKQTNLHNIIAALVVLAGLGYVIDALAPLVISDYALSVAAYVFVGELLLMFWLFWRAWQG